MKPDRIRPGGWVAKKWRYRAAQVTRAAIKRTDVSRETEDAEQEPADAQ